MSGGGALIAEADAAGKLMAALAGGWDEIRSRHPEVPPVVLAIGPGSQRRATRTRLASFGAMRWFPAAESDPSERQALRTAFDTAIEKGDFSAALSTSAEMLRIEATELSRQGRATLGEVYLTTAGLAHGATDVVATLLHEAAHVIASQRGIKDTSRQGRYHNRRFKTIAEELGLEVRLDPPIGWSATTLPHSITDGYAETLARLAVTLSAYRESESSLPASGARPTHLDCGCGHRTRDRANSFTGAAVICSACSGVERRATETLRATASSTPNCQRDQPAH